MVQIQKKTSVIKGDRQKKYLLASLWLICSLLIPFTSFAVGPGFKIGKKGAFHPRLYLNTGFDNNVFQRPSNTTTAIPVRNSPFLNIRPGIQLELPTRTISLAVNGYVNYSIYFQESSLNQLTGKADLVVKFFEESPVSVEFANYFSRNSGDFATADDVFVQTLPFYQAGVPVGDTLLTFNNTSKLEFIFQPGGGAFRFDLGYRFIFSIFQNQALDNHKHAMNLGVKWYFFPKTAITFNANFDIVNYAPRFDTSQNTPAAGPSADGMPFRATVGLVGQFTERLALLVNVGGGYTLIDETDQRAVKDASGAVENYGMVVGDISLTYNISFTTFVRVGFRHDFHPAAFSNFYHESVGSLEFFSQLSRFVITLRGEFGYIGFGSSPSQFKININGSPASPGVTRADLLARALASVDWNVRDWLSFGILGRFVFRNSNASITTSLGNMDLSFTRIEAVFKTELAF